MTLKLLHPVGRDTFRWPRLLQAPSILAVDTSRDEAMVQTGEGRMFLEKWSLKNAESFDSYQLGLMKAKEREVKQADL